MSEFLLPPLFQDSAFVPVSLIMVPWIERQVCENIAFAIDGEEVDIHGVLMQATCRVEQSNHGRRIPYYRGNVDTLGSFLLSATDLAQGRRESRMRSDLEENCLFVFILFSQHVRHRWVELNWRC